MGIAWEAYHKGVPLLGVPGITLDVLEGASHLHDLGCFALRNMAAGDARIDMVKSRYKSLMERIDFGAGHMATPPLCDSYRRLLPSPKQ